MAVDSDLLAARYHHTGDPAGVIQLDPLDDGPPGPGQVKVRMLYAPINPADLNMLEGKYGEARPLPDVAGNEGVGRVVEVGEGVSAPLPGRVVLVGSKTWRREGNWPAADLVTVPGGLDPRQASFLRVNPPTAWLMLHEFAALREGDWVVQNAATSGVGRAAVEIAKSRGLKSLNVVRRPEAAAELRALGADAVVVDGPEMAEAAAAELAGARPVLGLNAVGGASATRVAGLLGRGGTLVTYGAMSKEALKLPNGFLIFRDLRFRGFWLTRWLREAPPGAAERLYGEIFRLAGDGCFAPRVAAEFPLARVAEAVALAASGAAPGKVLLQLDA